MNKNNKSISTNNSSVDEHDDFVMSTVETPIQEENRFIFEDFDLASKRERQISPREQELKDIYYEPEEDHLLEELKSENYPLEVIECGDSFVGDGVGESYKYWEPDKPVFISAQTGKGKNFFVEETLLPYIRKMNHENIADKKILILSNRIALKSQTTERLSERYFVEILTYHSFLKIEQNWGEFSYVICDECHFFTSDSMFNPNTAVILQKIIRCFANAVRIYMTSTLSNCLRYIFDMEKEYDRYCNLNGRSIKVDPVFHYYKFNRDYSYLNIKPYSKYSELYHIIEKSIEINEKWLFFIDDKKGCRNLERKLRNNLNITKDDILVIDSESKDGADYEEIIKNEKFKQKILISTSVIDNGVNIKDLKLKNIVISDINKDKCLQMVGRKRVAAGEKVSLYMKLFNTKYMENQISGLEKQEDAYHCHDLAYSALSLDSIGTQRLSERSKFNAKYYNGDNRNFKNATHWFYRVDEKPEYVRYNHIARSYTTKVLIPRYNAIYDGMVKTGSGLKYLEHQLGWFGKAYSPEDNISKLSKENAETDFNNFIKGLCNRVLETKDEQDSFGQEFFNFYNKAYGFRAQDNESRTKAYGKHVINKIFAEQEIDLIITSNKEGWIINKKS